MLNGRQLAAARALIGITQKQLADEAKISVPTLKRMEASPGEVGGYRNNLEAVKSVLENYGIEFLNHGQPGVRLINKND